MPTAEVPTAGPTIEATNGEEKSVILGDAPEPWEAIAPEEASNPAIDEEEYNANEAWELRAPTGAPGAATANGEEEAWELRAPTGAPGVVAANGEEQGAILGDTTEPLEASGPAADEEEYNANEAWELRAPAGAPGVVAANGEEEGAILGDATEPWKAMAPEEASGLAADEEEYNANEAWELRAPAGAPGTTIADVDGPSDASMSANAKDT
ncbi:hypothetical protein OsI_06623 [Oryza sativa Indica Group]|uniref:Uncharacterized protein n=1 Tax=Oryza sativa subsp. indica TaxID=39946 RepID=B8AF95_ORYSI|nr:hypothetical protein OsI_06623 [Oryza sativa Indica Group]